MTEGQRWRPDKDLFASLLKIDKAGFSRCLEPSFRCTEPAIRAHSVQNSRLLDQLVRNGHVITFKRSVTLDGGPRIELAPIGRNQATTFTGLCARHDDLLFAPIEKTDLRIAEEEHRFLLAYRAAYRELHATIEGAMKLQVGHLERVRRHLDPKDSPSPAGLAAVHRMVVSWETYRYKSLLDTAYAKRDFSSMAHDVIEIDVAQPTVAACALFSVDNIHIRDDVLRIHINVLPVERTKTVAMFSYLRSDAPQARAFLNRILKSHGPYQRYEISRLILNSCENFVLSPEYVDTWSPEKQNAVETYFVHTLMKDDLAYESPHLYLF
jgi:hypothetical protein